MSYEICRGISINEKKNIITMSVASNNVYPHTFENVCYGNDNISFNKKIKLLLADVDGGNIQPYISATKFMYAFYKMKAELNINTNLYYVLNYEASATVYCLEGNRPHWNFKESFITQNDIDSGEYEVYSESNKWYKSKAEIEELKQKYEQIMDNAVELFLKYYNEKVPKQNYVLIKNNYCIKPIKNGRYRYGYSKEQIKSYNKTDWMYDYKKAYILSQIYNATMELI